LNRFGVNAVSIGGALYRPDDGADARISYGDYAAFIV
jgi:hypothetical protein